MSTDKGLFSKRIVWIGAGIAAVAVVVATQFFDIPSNSGVGTIVPAQRFQATQPGAGDVNASLGVGSTQVVTVVGADGDHALNDHALNDHALNDHAFNDHAINDHAINDHAINDHAINDHAINDHAAADGNASAN